MVEVEMKLELSEAATAALLASGILPADPDVRTLRAVYFDTPDHALKKAGLSLRLRSSGSETIQTIKANGAAGAGLFMRSEWEVPVTGDTPILDATTPVAALLGGRSEDVAPLFRVEVERRTWRVKQGKSRIEVVLDTGRVIAGEAEQPVHELELELEDGSPATLFTLARRIDAVAPARLGVQTKGGRGYRLTKGPQPSYKAQGVALGRDMAAAQAFQQIAQECLRQFRMNEGVLLEDRSSKALHQARVALRRLRSAFTIFKPLFAGDRKAAPLREGLRWLAGELGEARNLDVLVEQVPAGALHDRLSAARDTAYDAVEHALGSSRARGLMFDLVEWLSAGAWLRQAATADRREEPARDFAADTLDRVRRKVRKHGRDLASLDDEARHTLRKDAKKLRYASEFFAPLFDAKQNRKRHKRFIAALEELQDELGALNDMATAPEELRKLGLQDDAEARKLLEGGGKSKRIAAAAKAHDAFSNTKRFWR